MQFNNINICTSSTSQAQWLSCFKSFVKYYSDITNTNIKIRNAIYDDFKLRSNLKKLDYAFYSYFNLYTSLYVWLTDEINNATKSKIDNTISNASMLSTIFSTVVVAYFMQSKILTEDIIIDKMSELNTLVEPSHHRLPKNIKDLLEKSSSVSLF